ncbi:MAG: hypothetical protein CME64_08460 [Halobacteriovoraceae bacterium]|nr:hypothetical protein [Halobacteriovoraceae bacterium]|tara:strand:+ start:424 stop:687 length:264 start_codon:yes stop_codon:yes gene_type:complete
MDILGNKQKKHDHHWQKKLASHLKSHIYDKGYCSEYDFWIQECGDDISRANLNNILNGKVDPRVSTLKKLANNLGMTLSSLVKGIEN